MDVKKVAKFLDKRIEDLEKANYIYETVVKPRAKRDKEILESMREQRLKLQTLIDKLSRGEEVSQEEFYSAVPSEFR